MRMLFTLFSTLFILGTHSVVHALATIELCNPETDSKNYQIIYNCDADENIFTQEYADITKPCLEINANINGDGVNYITCNKDFTIPSFLTKESVVTYDTSALPNDISCITSLTNSSQYPNNAIANCTKSGYKIVGWTNASTNDSSSFVLVFSGDIASLPPGHENKTIIDVSESNEYTSTWQWNSDLTVSPVWDTITMTCPPGQYIENGTEKNQKVDVKCTSCKEGFYCPGVTDEKYNPEKDTGLRACPAGATSNTDASRIEDCYLAPEQTKFCGASTGDCIYMPTSAEPANHTGTTETSDK